MANYNATLDIWIWFLLCLCCIDLPFQSYWQFIGHWCTSPAEGITTKRYVKALLLSNSPGSFGLVDKCPSQPHPHAWTVHSSSTSRLLCPVSRPTTIWRIACLYPIKLSTFPGALALSATDSQHIYLPLSSCWITTLTLGHWKSSPASCLPFGAPTLIQFSS